MRNHVLKNAIGYVEGSDATYGAIHMTVLLESGAQSPQSCCWIWEEGSYVTDARHSYRCTHRI